MTGAPGTGRRARNPAYPWRNPGFCEWEGGASRVFLTMPVEEADTIKAMVPQKGGFGSIRVELRLGDTVWHTSLFPDKCSGSHVLPVKRAVRKAEEVQPGDTVEVDVFPVDA